MLSPNFLQIYDELLWFAKFYLRKMQNKFSSSVFALLYRLIGEFYLPLPANLQVSEYYLIFA